MDTSSAFVGLTCIDCGELFTAEGAGGRREECGGILDPVYEYSDIEVSVSTLESRPFDSMWRYEDLLPFPSR